VINSVCEKNAPTIAVLDTGSTFHPDLGRRIIGFKDFVNDKNSLYDDSGHGTHVCGIIAGDGTASNGKYQGVAPCCKLVVGKVLDKDGNGTADAMIDGIEWIIENQKHYSIKVLNVSIGIGQLINKEKVKQLIECLEKAWDHGIVVVCAAGNGGPDLDTISPLGKGKKIIAVGCHDGEYFKDMPKRCEIYSGRGDYNLAYRKPDIVAPGTEIISCNAYFKKMTRGHYNVYVSKSGTSMATPIVSGAVGLYLTYHPECGNDYVKKQLLYSATDLGAPWYQQGYGMINVEKMLQ